MDDVEIIKSKVDIVDVISGYIPLKRAGRNFAGLCPFHGEKTASFMVSPERQVFKCFGCQEAGDVFTFLEKTEGWDFREVLEELAKRVGVTIKSFKPTDESRQKEKLLKINELAEKFYSYILQKHKKGDDARLYLKKRGIKEVIWQKFGIGYAPEGWENTFSFLKKRNFNQADIAASGLVIAKQRATDKSYYDRFRNRLVFPLRDIRGLTLGFSGRLIDEGNGKEPKYLNSPETEVFHKGSLLFGLDIAKEEIRKVNEVLLVEGEFDALSAYQVGIKNVVASKGTALTERQIAILSRLCENVALCFDEDLAGDKASRRGIEMMDETGLTVKVVKLGKFKDPDEFCQKDAEGFKKAVAKASNIYDYFLESTAKRFDAASPMGKKKIGAEMLPVLSKITDDLVRAHYISKLAKLLDLDVFLIAAAVEKKQSSLNVYEKQAVEVAESGDFLKKKVSLEEYFLALFLAGDELNSDFFAIIEAKDFENSDCSRFWTWLHDIIKRSKVRNTQKLLGNLPKDLTVFVDNLYLVNIDSELLDRKEQAAELIKIGERIKKDSVKRKLFEVSGKIKEAEAEEDLESLKNLSDKFSKLSRELKNEKD